MATAALPGLRHVAVCGVLAVLITILFVFPLPATAMQEDPELPIGEQRSREVEPDSIPVSETPEPTAKTIPLYDLGILVGDFVADDKAFYLGGTFCLRFLPKVRTGLFVTAAARVGEQIVREQIRPQYFIQRKETRWYVALGLEQVLRILPPLDLFIQAAPGYTTGDYKGTERDPEKGWIFLGRAGLAFRFAGQDKGSLLVRLGYQYSDLKTNGPSMFYGALGLEF